MSWKRFVVGTDNHGNLGCHDAIGKFLAFVEQWNPHYRIHLGDCFDFAGLRKKASPEERAERLSVDYRAGLDFLDAYRPHYLTLGNHDWRLWRASDEFSEGILSDLCRQQADALEGELRSRKIKWCQWGVGNFLTMPEGGPKLLHGYRATMAPAKAHWDNWGPNLHGHVHKPDSYNARHIDGGISMSVPCLADLSRLSYANGTPAKLAWRQGWAYGMIESKTGRWQAWHVTNEGGRWISPMGEL